MPKKPKNTNFDFSVQDRLRLGIAQTKTNFCLALSSTCTIFAQYINYSVHFISSAVIMLQDIYNSIISPDVNLIGAIAKLVLSLVLGATIGIERRRKGQIAGLRTFALISMGATLAMLISIYIPQEYLGLKNGDPGRIAAQVVSGVGFLGAGAIIQMKGSVRGLTTAAGIWMTACIGLAVGAGMYLISIIATLLIIFILVNIERIEQRHNFLWESKIIRVKMHGILDDIQPLRDTITSKDVHISDEFMKFDYEDGFTIVNFMVRSNSLVNVPVLFKEIKQLGDPISITITNEMNM